MNFILAKTFSDSLAKLDKPAQSLVKGAVFDFEQNPDLPGFQFHRVTKAKDPNMWTARVNDDLRMVIHHKGDRMVFCWVDRHDPAYTWAETRKIVENEATGSAQIVEIKEVVQEVTRTVIREVVRKPALFKSHEPSYLLALGTPPEWLEAVRHVDEDGLDALKDHLPAEAFERLYSLALGEVVPVPVRPAAASDPFLHPDAQRRFAVMTDQEEIRRALEQPWEQWMVFLHPTQRAVVARRYNGPARVTGSAGTGKSVVAIHRAARLAREVSKGAVLLTTYSRTLAARLAEQLALILPAQGNDGPVVVEHLHRVAHSLREAAGAKPFHSVEGKDLPDLIKTALVRAQPRVSLTVPFLRAEWEAVVDAWGIDTWDAYRAAPRTGRGVPLGAKQRQEVWKVFECLQAILQERKLMTWNQLCYDAARRVKERSPFRHVIADEVQDFGPAEFTLLRALTGPAADDLFLCGDAGQRIYRARFQPLALGIDVRGRATRLKVNYRTTEQIRRFADAMVPSVIDEGEGLDGSRATVSVLRGPAPEARGFADVQGEIAAIASWVKALRDEGFAPRDIAVFGRSDGVLKEQAVKALEAAKVPLRKLSDKEAVPTDAAAVGTMHRAKGLEFRAVAVVGCAEGVLPASAALKDLTDPEDLEAVRAQERQLLYVAATRARERLLITWSGTMSPLLHGLDETLLKGARA
jgi:superfamily I DNA/RNA helicase